MSIRDSGENYTGKPLYKLKTPLEHDPDEKVYVTGRLMVLENNGWAHPVVKNKGNFFVSKGCYCSASVVDQCEETGKTIPPDYEIISHEKMEKLCARLKRKKSRFNRIMKNPTGSWK